MDGAEGKDSIDRFSRIRPGTKLGLFNNNNKFLIQCLMQIINGYENIDRNIFFSLKKDNRTREHEVTLVKDQCRLDIRKHSFSQKTINEWNKLSTDCLTASSICLKTRLTHISGGQITHRLKMLDSRQANGFLVHLPPGPLPWMVILLKHLVGVLYNGVQWCMHHIIIKSYTFKFSNVQTSAIITSKMPCLCK